MNESISINVLCIGDEGGFTPLHVSKHLDRPHRVNLLLLEGNERKHYVCIRNMSALVCGRTTDRHKVHVCFSCLHPFYKKETLERHEPYCQRHPPQHVKYPDPDNCVAEFRNKAARFRLPFYLVCDFESFLSPVDSDRDAKTTRVVEQHNVCGFACYRVTKYEQYQTPPVVYSGENVMDNFYDHILNEYKVISKIVYDSQRMKPLTADQQADFDAATTCAECGEYFTQTNRKVRHHDHIDGTYMCAACNNCNLNALKYPQRKRKATQGRKDNKKIKVDTSREANFFLPVVFHNLQAYDAHFVIKHFKRQYTKDTKITQEVDDNDVAEEETVTETIYGDVVVTPLNGEKYLSFQVGNLRFLDSFQFLSTSLENLVDILKDKGSTTDDYVDKFVHTTKHIGDDKRVFAKGVYPYSYMTGRDKFAETKLPPIEAFYNTLNDEPLAEKDYARAQEIWSHFDMKTMQDYHDHYLLTDVLLLADVFENFRTTVYHEHHLDPLHFITLPSLAWTSAMKYTRAKLDLITDPDMYLMIENNMRGGIATISHRHAVANNPQLEGYDPDKPHSYITYLDANNLYGTAMSEPLPVGNFRFLSEQEISDFDVMTVPADGPVGYILECDLSYPEHLHDEHSDYPMAPEHVTVTFDMLSDYAREIVDRNWKASQKLVPNLRDKTKYVCRHRSVQFYMEQGLIITKIHRVIAFD